MTCDDTHTLAELRVGCYNCNGMGGKHKRDQVLNWLKNKNEKIIFIQETNSTKATEADRKKTGGGGGDEITFNHVNHGTSSSTGVAILFTSNEIKLVNQIHIAPGRATLADVQSGGEVFGLINVYCPNNDDTGFLNNVFLEACSKTK